MKENVIPIKGKYVERISRFLFGDDVFISYARKDATTYSLALADELTKHELSCFLDQWGTPPGEKLPKTLIQSLQNSTMFILLGTERAAVSEAVRKEVEEFLKTGRTIIPVSFDGALEKADWFHLIKGWSGSGFSSGKSDSLKRPRL